MQHIKNPLFNIDKKEGEMHGIDYWIGGKELMETPVTHLMEKNVVAFGEEASLHTLAETMFEGDFGRHPGGFGSIPIIDDEKKLIGIVREFDILNGLLKGKSFSKTTASEIMTKPVISIPDDMDVDILISLLQTHHLIRVPVVDAEGRLIGIVARRDVIGCYIEASLGTLPCF